MTTNVSDPDLARRVERDARETWTYAINAAPTPTPSEDDDSARRLALTDARRERFGR
jgi:hypothetical protein